MYKKQWLRIQEPMVVGQAHAASFLWLRPPKRPPIEPRQQCGNYRLTTRGGFIMSAGGRWVEAYRCGTKECIWEYVWSQRSAHKLVIDVSIDTLDRHGDKPWYTIRICTQLQYLVTSHRSRLEEETGTTGTEEWVRTRSGNPIFVQVGTLFSMIDSWECACYRDDVHWQLTGMFWDCGLTAAQIKIRRLADNPSPCPTVYPWSITTDDDGKETTLSTPRMPKWNLNTPSNH